MQYNSVSAATVILTGQKLLVTETEIDHGVEYDLSFIGNPIDFNFFAISNGLTSQGFTEVNSLLTSKGWTSHYISRSQWDQGWTWNGNNGDSTNSSALGTFDSVFNELDGGASILWMGEPLGFVFSGEDILREQNELELLNSSAFSDFVVANNNTILDSSHSASASVSVPTPSAIVLVGFGLLGLLGSRQQLSVNEISEHPSYKRT